MVNHVELQFFKLSKLTSTKVTLFSGLPDLFRLQYWKYTFARVERDAFILVTFYRIFLFHRLTTSQMYFVSLIFQKRTSTGADMLHFLMLCLMINFLLFAFENTGTNSTRTAVVCFSFLVRAHATLPGNE